MPDGSSIATEATYLRVRKPSRIWSVWIWVLRICLPVVIALNVRVLQWLWVDNVYGTRWLDIVGGTAMALGLLSVILWCVCVWLSNSEGEGQG